MGNYIDEHLINRIDKNTRVIAMDGSRSYIKGDSNSSCETFEIDRFYDGVDLSTKDIKIIYQRPDGNGDSVNPENIAVEDEVIRFAWVLDDKVLAVGGKLHFCVEFRGVESGRDYSFKTKSAVLRIEDDTLNESEITTI